MAIAETQVYMPQAPRPRLRLLEDERWLAFVLLVPTLVLLGMFIAYPFVRGILLSVTSSRVGVPGEFVGLANFYKIFNDGIFRTSVYNTFVYTGVTTVFKLALGLWLAMLLNRNFRGKTFTRAFILLPFIIPTVLSTFAWKWLFDPTFSVLNWVLYHFGLITGRINWLGDPDLAMISIIIVNIWRGVPFFAISLLAGLQTISPELSEAAAIDGAKPWQRFWHITWPLLLPVTMVVVLFSVIQTFADLQIVYVMTGGGPANATHLFVIIQLLYIRRVEVRLAMSEGAIWRKWIFFYVPMALFLLFLLFPFYWMVITSVRPDGELYRPWNSINYNPFWTWKPTWDHVRYLFEETLFASWLWNTMFIALMSTAISLVCGVFAGYALSRLNFPFACSLGTGIFITYPVPQTLLFIPLAEMIRNYRLGDTPWSLILTYPTFLIPFSTWLMMGYFKAVPKELEECARIDGASRWQAMLYIIIPVAIPGILSAGIFAFTLSWNEFIYALVFLSSPDQKTVPVGVTSELIRGDVFFWGPVMAGALLGSIPVAIVYSFFVEHYVSGLTGSVKG